MSEYFHNGSVVFDRLLTKEESEEICRIFSDEPTPGGNSFCIGEFKPRISAEPVSCLDFDDYSTGRSGLVNELEELVSCCESHGIGIDSYYTLINYYGDEDGGYLIDNGEVIWLDRDEVGVANADTRSLIEELQRRKALPQPLETVPTEDLVNELYARGFDTESVVDLMKPAVYVVTSGREYENDERYYGPDAVFLTMKHAYRYVTDEMQDVCREFQIDPEDTKHAHKLGDEYFELDWDGHRFFWAIHLLRLNQSRREA